MRVRWWRVMLCIPLFRGLGVLITLMSACNALKDYIMIK